MLHVLPAMVLVGTGCGLCFPALMGLAMSDATPEDSGLASGLVNTSAQVGGAIGLAVLATIATERTGALTAAGEPAAAALNGGFHLAYVVGATLVALAAVVGAVVIRTGGEPPAEPCPEPCPEREPLRARPAYEAV